MPREWKYFIDVHDIWQDESPDFEMKRNAIVDRIRASTTWDAFRHDDRLEDIVNEIEDATTVEDFDWVWNDLYDWADENRVWIDVHAPVVKPIEDDLKRLLTELKGP